MSTPAHNYKLLTEGESFQSRCTYDDQPPWWTNIWRGVNVVMAVFFFLAAVVQINDPDPYLWVPVYAIPGLFSLLVMFNPMVTLSSWWKHLVVAHLTLCMSACLYLVVVLVELLSTGLANPLIHEEGRELAGLVIIIVWLIVSRFTKLGNPKPGKDSISALLLVTGILALLPLVVWGLCFVDGLTHKLGHCTDMFNGGLFSSMTKQSNMAI